MIVDRLSNENNNHKIASLTRSVPLNILRAAQIFLNAKVILAFLELQFYHFVSRNEQLLILLTK